MVGEWSGPSFADIMHQRWQCRSLYWQACAALGPAVQGYQLHLHSSHSTLLQVLWPVVRPDDIPASSYYSQRLQ